MTTIKPTPPPPPLGRNFTPTELKDRMIRITTAHDRPHGMNVHITADGVTIANAYSIFIRMGATEIVEATVCLLRFDLPDIPADHVIIKENLELDVSTYIIKATDEGNCP